MKRKNNKGFTLIELLVAVAIMLSLLGIAIVSFINVSDKKKEESWESVKSQIETAAEQYFKSNEYKYEGLSGDVKGIISLGALVSNDYLNAVTDPRTGKQVSYCTQVEVTKTINGVFTTKIIEGSENNVDNTEAIRSACDTDNSVIVSEVGAPKLTVTGNGATTNNSGWFTGNVTITANVNEDGNGTIVNFKKCGNTSSNCEPTTEIANKNKDEQTHSLETSNYEYCYSATNAKGKTTKACYNFKIDKTAPTLTVGLYKKTSEDLLYSSTGLSTYDNNTWYKGWVYTDTTTSDNLSGIASTTYTTTGATINATDNVGTKRNVDAQGTSYIEYKTCDKAGNCTSSSKYTIKLDRTAPNFNVGLYKKTNTNNVTSSSGLSNYTSGDWYNQGIFTKAMDRDDGKDSKGVNMSGIDTTTYTTTGSVGSNSKVSNYYYNINAEGNSTIQYTVCDKVGNCRNSSTYTIKLDRTKPKGTLTLSSTKTSYNSNVVNVSMTADDTNGTKTVSGIKTVVYTDRLGNQTYNGNNNTTWSNTLNNRTIFSSLTTSQQSVNSNVAKVVITDNAGNVSDNITGNYSTYALCTNKNSSTTYSSWSSCNKTCGGGTKKRTVTTTYKDTNNTSYTCSSNSTEESLPCNTQACTKTCPTITVNGTKGSNDWYKKGTISLSHNGDSGYWTWYRGTTNLNSTSTTLSTGILEGTYTYKIKGQNGEECTKEVSYDNSDPSCSISLSGNQKDSSSGWYTGNVTVTLTKSGESSYGLTTSTTADYNSKTTATQTADTTGITYYGYVKDTAGNTYTCNKNVKKDTVAPTYTLKTTTLTHLGYSDINNISNTKVFEGKFNVNKSGNTYIGTICYKNIANGAAQVNDVAYITSDATSKVKTIVDNGYVFKNKCGTVVSYCPRTGSPCTQEYSLTLTDYAGNSAKYTTVKLNVGYILESTSNNYYSDCYLWSYTKRYSSILTDLTSWNISTNMTSGEIKCNN